ncbi:MAG: hypothetical protein Q4D17_02380, partial [Planctomycetia bacterium]|nr:hypothetical protein [Planctomycetia bacterium]
MRRNTSPQNLENGQDSFLDVVSNIVGILIILVVIVGAQVKNGLTTHRIVEFEKNRNLQRKQTEEITRQTDSPSPEEQFVDTELDSELNALLAEGRKDQNDEYEKKKRSELIEKIKVSSQQMNETIALERKLAEEAAQLEIQQKRMEAEQLVFAQECVQMETRLRLIQKEIESSTEKKDQERNTALQLTQTSIEMDRKIEELKNR